MKALIEYIEDIEKIQEKQAKSFSELTAVQEKNNNGFTEKQNEIAKKLDGLEIQQSQVIVNQEYANCLLELNS